MNGYKAFHKSKSPIEVYANTSYQAQSQAAVLWNLKPSQRRDITVVLCEKQDKPVIHVTTE